MPNDNMVSIRNLDQLLTNADYKEYYELKQEVLKKVKETKDFTVIKNSFPNADVSDIILKS